MNNEPLYTDLDTPHKPSHGWLIILAIFLAILLAFALFAHNSSPTPKTPGAPYLNGPSGENDITLGQTHQPMIDYKITLYITVMI